MIAGRESDPIATTTIPRARDLSRRGDLYSAGDRNSNLWEGRFVRSFPSSEIPDYVTGVTTDRHVHLFSAPRRRMEFETRGFSTLRLINSELKKDKGRRIGR